MHAYSLWTFLKHSIQFIGGKLLEILLAYGLPQETVNAISLLYQDSKSMVRSPDGDTDFFQIVSGVLQGDTFAP